MATIVDTLHLVGPAFGAVGAALLFLEFFQLPSYFRYDRDFESYSVDISPEDAQEYTWIGRIGAILLALGFASQFLAQFLT
jgi:hypothetical protein